MEAEKITADYLKNEASKFVDTRFNFIQLNVLQKMANDCLYEYIRPEEPDYLEFLNNYGLHSEFKDATEQEAEEADTETLKEFCENESSFDSWVQDVESGNYPMWNTCFEFRDEPSEEVIQAAIDAGFGIIEGLDDFNTILFSSGCGYSFYGAHWIPLFLNLPWNKDLKKQAKEVNYSHY